MNDLESLLKELGCKTPVDEIPADRRDTILDFLKMEIEYRRQRKIKRLLSISGIKHVKTLDQFDWHFNPKISKDDILAFVQSPWIENAFNLVLIGDTGLGKSHIAAGICYEATLRGYPSACNPGPDRRQEQKMEPGNLNNQWKLLWRAPSPREKPLSLKRHDA